MGSYSRQAENIAIRAARRAQVLRELGLLPGAAASANSKASATSSATSY